MLVFEQIKTRRTLQYVPVMSANPFMTQEGSFSVDKIPAVLQMHLATDGSEKIIMPPALIQ
jgi:hypothetical protein